VEQGRVDQFKADVSRLRIRTGDARRDGILWIAGAVLIAGGIMADLVVDQVVAAFQPTSYRADLPGRILPGSPAPSRSYRSRRTNYGRRPVAITSC
jgi:hypothetical protein